MSTLNMLSDSVNLPSLISNNLDLVFAFLYSKQAQFSFWADSGLFLLTVLLTKRNKPLFHISCVLFIIPDMRIEIYDLSILR